MERQTGRGVALGGRRLQGGGHLRLVSPATVHGDARAPRVRVLRVDPARAVPRV